MQIVYRSQSEERQVFPVGPTVFKTKKIDLRPL